MPSILSKEVSSRVIGFEMEFAKKQARAIVAVGDKAISKCTSGSIFSKYITGISTRHMVHCTVQ